MTSKVGRLIAVVGPSGVGKDTLIAAGRAHLSDRRDLGFVRRTITRPAGDDAEAHEAVTREQFNRLLESGAFCFWWDAHGLRYGLPSSLSAELDAGRHMIVNGSRRVLDDLHARFPSLAILSVTAEPSIVARRITERGREDAAQISARIARQAVIPNVAPIAVVDNSATLQQGVMRFLTGIEALINA